MEEPEKKNEVAVLEDSSKKKGLKAFFSRVAAFFARTTPLIEKDVTFSYAEGFAKDDEEHVFYSDSFFFEENSAFSKPLALASLGFAMSCFSSNALKEDLSLQSKNVGPFLSSCGFSNVFTPPYFDQQSLPSGVAYAFAKKRIKTKDHKFTLVAIAIRGANYGKEWSSNFLIGKQPTHEGFSEASIEVLGSLEKYMQEHKVRGEVKFWITGYSRGAAIANILSHDLHNGLFSFPKKAQVSKVYSYCFATPKVSKEAKEEEGIFNILNPYDLICRVPAWGFRRFGQDIFLPCHEEIEEPKFHLVDTSIFKRNKNSGPVDAKLEFSSKVEEFIGHKIPMDRYVSFYQQCLKDVMSLVDPRKENPYEEIGNFIGEVLKEVNERYGKLRLVGKILSSKTNWKELLTPAVASCLEGKAYSVHEDALSDLLADVLSLLREDLLSSRDFYLTLGNNDNLRSFIIEHRPALYLELLRSYEA